jgi:hypothetical protein
MALLKTIYAPDNTGCAAAYWKICDIKVDPLAKHGDIELMGYISLQAFSDGKNPLMIKTYEIRNDVFDSYFSETAMNVEGVNIYSQGYSYIIAYSGDFSDATEVD